MHLQFKQRLFKPFKGLKKMENYFTWGVLVNLVDGDWYVDVGAKSLVKVPKIFFQDTGIIPVIGKKILVYVSRYSDAKGMTRIDQSRVVYHLNYLRLMRLYNAGKVISGEISQVKVSGYIVKLLPHRNMGVEQCFYGFMPNSYALNQNSLNVGSSVNVKIKYFNTGNQSIILNVDEQRVTEVFNNLHVGEKVVGTIVSLRRIGAITLVKDFYCLLPYQDCYFDNRSLEPSVLTVGQKVEDLIIFKKNVEHTKVYLSAKHIFDSLENYFKLEEEVECTVLDCKSYGYLVRINKYDDVNFKGYINFTNSSWNNSRYVKKFRVNQKIRAKIIKMIDLRVYLSCRFEDQNYWQNLSDEITVNKVITLNPHHGDHSVQVNRIVWDDYRKHWLWCMNHGKAMYRAAYQSAKAQSRDVRFVIYKHIPHKAMIELKPCRWLSIIELMFNLRSKRTNTLTLVSFKDNLISFVLPQNNLLLHAQLHKINDINLEPNKVYRYEPKFFNLKQDKAYLNILEEVS